MTVGTKAALTPSFKFVGNFPRSLDAKGRVILPSRMRAHFQEHGYRRRARTVAWRCGPRRSSSSRPNDSTQRMLEA